MSDSAPHVLTLPNFDAATLQLSRAIALLHCVSAAIDPDNANTTRPDLALTALDSVIATIEQALSLLRHPPAEIVQIRQP